MGVGASDVDGLGVGDGEPVGPSSEPMPSRAGRKNSATAAIAMATAIPARRGIAGMPMRVLIVGYAS